MGCIFPYFLLHGRIPPRGGSGQHEEPGLPRALDCVHGLRGDTEEEPMPDNFNNGVTVKQRRNALPWASSLGFMERSRWNPRHRTEPLSLETEPDAT